MAENPYNQNNFFTDFGAGAFGMSVSQADYLRRQSQQRDRSAFQNSILQHDPRAQMAAAMWEQNIGGEFTPEGRARTRLVAGSMINSRMVSEVFGGSRLDMFSGMVSGLGNAGIMRLNVNGHPQQVFGPGGVTNVMARQMMRQVESQMFNEQGGARLHRTHGLNRSELGGAMGYMGTRGMLSDINGVSTTYDEGTSRRDLKQRRADARDPFEREQLDRILKDEGGTLFDKGGKLTERQQIITVSEADRKRVADDVEDVAKTLGMIKGIMGDIGTSGLLQALDALSSGQGKQGMQAAQNRLRNFKVAEMSGGGRADALLNAHVQMSQTYQQLGMSRHMALSAADSDTAAFSTSRLANQEWVNQMAQKGIYVANPTDSMAQTLVADTLALDSENPELATALFAIQRDRNLSPEQRATLLAQAGQVGKAGSIEEMQRRSAGLAAAVGSATGVSMREWNRRAGGDPLSLLQGAQAQTYLDVSQEEMQRRMMGQLQNDMGGTALDRQAAAAIATEFSKSSMANFKEGDGISERLTSLGIAGDKQAGFVDQLMKTLGAPKYSTLLSDEERQAEAARQIEALRTEGKLDGVRSTNTIIGGLLGEENISDAIAAEYMMSKGEGRGIEHSIEKLDMSGMSDVEKAKALKDAQQRGFVFSDKDGNFSVLSNEAVEAGRKALEVHQKKKRAKALGVSVEDLEDPEKVSEVAKAANERFDALLADSDTEIKELDELASAAGSAGGQSFVSKLDKAIAAEKASAEKMAGKKKHAEAYDTKMERIGELEDLRNKINTEAPFDPASAVERIILAIEALTRKV